MRHDDERIRAAAEVSVRQLEQAIAIVEDAFGTDLEGERTRLLAAVLSALAPNYREGSTIERRRPARVPSNLQLGAARGSATSCIGLGDYAIDHPVGIAC